MTRPEDSTARFDARLLLETSRLLMQSKDPEVIARHLALVLMGKLMVSQAAVLLTSEDGGFDIAFLKGRSPWKDGGRFAVEGSARGEVPWPGGGGTVADGAGVAMDGGGLAAALFPSAAGHWQRPIGTPEAHRGVIVFGLRAGQLPFDAEQIDLIENICNLAAIALDHAASIHELRETNRSLDRRAHELDTLFELSKELGSLLDRRRIADVLKFTLMGHLVVRQSMIAVRDGDGISLLASAGLKRPPSPEELAECFARAETAKAAGVVGEAGRTPFMTANGLASLIGLPSTPGEPSDGMAKAVIGVGRKLDGSDLTEDDVQFIRSVSNVGFMAMDNVRLLDEIIEKRRMERELSIARTIQRQLFPDPIPQILGLEAAAVNIPSEEVGGDYVDAAQTPDGNMVYAIADVSGKGVPASLLMANLQAMIQVLIPIDISLSDAVGRINNLLHEHTPSDRFITFFLAKYHVSTGRVEYVNAGHNPPMLFRKGTGIPERLSEGGMLLGAMPTFQPYGTGSVILREGDVLLLFTDGVTEAADRQGTQHYGEERLAAEVARLMDAGLGAEAILEGLVEDVRRFGSGIFTDDLTALVIRRTA